jgi:SAM-dependent methyltransferase/DNA-directed RNA polymerase subunit RPC12/RpoP
VPEEIKDLDNLSPIDHAVVAKPHTAVYKMHRYFARRPWSVFRALIEHYSNPGSIILDPFCGGGVTVVEGLRLRRKVIGVDINPLATFITTMEAVDFDVYEFKSALASVEAACREEIESLYLTTCPKCGKTVPADWLEWSNVVQCKECGRPVELHQAPREQRGEKIAGVSAGKFKCNHPKCGATWRPAECTRLADTMTRVHVTCPACGEKSEVGARPEDKRLATELEGTLEGRLVKERIWYPTAEMPDWWDLRRPYNSHIKTFRQFFTPRNLFANAFLGTHIKDADLPPNVRSLLALVFSASLRFTNRMVCRNVAWRGDKPLEWASSTYWLPEVHLEVNCWQAWQNRQRAILRGKQYSRAEIGSHCRLADNFSDLAKEGTALIHTGSASALPIPDESVDAIITDPPYGNNVLYAELCNFYWVWVGGILGQNGLIDDREEAVVSKEHGKGIGDYRDLLLRVFRECHRVLKPGRWMVMTFHNREFKVWNAIHLAAHDAGFVLAESDGMIYQPPITNYTQTIQTRRQGSMLGDFVLSFKKAAKAPALCAIEHAEIGRHIERLAAEAVLHHHGAGLSTIYMKLIPWLLNNNLLDKIGQAKVVTYLHRNFEERQGVWLLKEKPDEDLRRDLERYSKEHYKASYQELDFVPIEARIEYLIRRLLYAAPGFATQDEILHQIYKNLINSNMAEVREIQRVLESLAQLVTLSNAGRGRAKAGKKGRRVWRLKEDVQRELLFKEMGADVQYRLATSEESDHDLAIARLVEIGGLRKMKAHIGRTEQTKYTEFRRMSSDLPERIKGLPAAARAIIEQIDVLWHNGGRGVAAAFEVERTTTITSGIQRFRDLVASLPGKDIALYLVIPQTRAREVRKQLLSPANRKEMLDKKVRYIYLEDLQIRARDPSAVDFEKIVRAVSET